MTICGLDVVYGEDERTESNRAASLNRICTQCHCRKSMHRKAFEQGPPVGPCSNLKIKNLDPSHAAGGWFWTASTKSSVKPM